MRNQSHSNGSFTDGFSRRDFLGRAASAAVGLSIVPRHVLGGRGYVAPSDRLTLACIGVGAQGTRVMMSFLKEPDVQVVAVCDVNRESSDYVEWGPDELRGKVRQLLGDSGWGSRVAPGTAGRDPARNIVEAYYGGGRDKSGHYRGCTAYNDFREVLANQRDLDAVVVCTPDHWHAPVSIMAMRAKKHVYCQKPMTRSIAEARQMAEVARQTGVATQVAIGNSASEATRLLSEWIAAGAIGPVRRVENWSTRPFWPQGINRPERADAIPPGLDWSLWLGPAPDRPFSHVYLPFVWRGWYDFGCGALGDMGQYSFDTIFRVLKLASPSKVDVSSTAHFKETYPVASIVRLEFPARQAMPAATLTWYDGNLKPARPEELEDGRPLKGQGSEEDEGLLFIGDSGKILCGHSGSNPRLIPEAKMREFQPPPKTLPRSIGHYREWIEACKGGAPGAANFEFEAPIAQGVLLGNVALQSGEEMLRWDGSSMKVTNSEVAQALVYPKYRPEWESQVGAVPEAGRGSQS